MKISVLMPMYNCADYVKQTLESVRCQTMPQSDIEIIVYLDGCTDCTPMAVGIYASEHPEMNIKIIKCDENHGLAHGRNMAAAAATGDFLHFMDCDDIINCDFYQSLYAAATRTNANWQLHHTSTNIPHETQ